MGLPQADGLTSDFHFAWSSAACAGVMTAPLRLGRLHFSSLQRSRGITGDPMVLPTPAPMKSYASSSEYSRATRTHPGACHYYIHAVEAVDPQAAVVLADGEIFLVGPMFSINEGQGSVRCEAECVPGGGEDVSKGCDDSLGFLWTSQLSQKATALCFL